MADRLWRRALPIDALRNALSYDAETGELRWKVHRSSNARAGQIAGCHSGRGYLVVAFEGHTYFAHRVAWALHYGDCPEHIDHINGDGTDNRIANLRRCSQTTNNQNMKPRKGASRFKGVTRWNNRGCAYWRARIVVDGREQSLGYFKTEDEAAAAYRDAAARHFGEFARAA